MLSFYLLVGTLCSLTAANPHPWMYGVPDFPDLDMNEVMTQADIDSMMAAADNESVIATTASSSASITATNNQEPCAVISSALAALPSDARRIVPAELGLQCLQSVPLDREGDMKLIDDLQLYIKWQSNTAYLKDPPKGYNEQPVDVVGELDDLKNQLAAGVTMTEYDFQMQIMDTFSRAYDNHFAWQPDILASAMQFQRPPGSELVSVSTDGTALPEIFIYRDIILANRDSSFTPSAITTIDGSNVQDYLRNISAQGDFHDADTRYNALFPSQALIASGTTFLGSFRTGLYPGSNTTIEFVNGTVYSQMNVAVVFGNMTGVNNGQSFFRRFCTGPQPVVEPPPQPTQTSNPKRPMMPTDVPEPSHIGYPKAEIINRDLAVGGYYLSGSGYENVAVLSIPTYSSPDVQSFQDTMRNFIRASKKAGKTRMVFDLRGNGGGNAILGYDTFKQVYPQTEQEPYGGMRFRANDALGSAGKITQDFIEGSTFAQSNETAFAQVFGPGTTQADIFGFTSVFNYQHVLDIENKAYTSWEQFFGPAQANGDRFTNTLRYNFSDGISTTYQGFSVIGFGANANETQVPQPFEAQDMVMLHDGMCSSTCAIASELLKNQGSVRTIAIGGRPQTGPMQGVGGTKGAQVFNWDEIQVRMQAVYFLGSPEQQAQWDKEDLGKTAFASQIFKRSAYQNSRIAGGVNLKDNLREFDDSQIPLEFIYEAADCRMFFTAPMITDVTLVWKGVVDRMFNGQVDKCVEGSTGDPSSISGGGQFRAGDGSITKGAAVQGNRTSPANSQFTGNAPESMISWWMWMVTMGACLIMVSW